MCTEHPDQKPHQKYSKISWATHPFAPSLWVGTVILTQLVAGCGQTGALYLPQATDVAVTDGRPEGDADTAVTDTPTDVDATPSSSDPESVLPPP